MLTITQIEPTDTVSIKKQQSNEFIEKADSTAISYDEMTHKLDSLMEANEKIKN